MSNKKIRVLAFILALLLIAPSSALAHSGRTDASGGHRDNKNASGLGSYHYHHGYSAHLHPNGVCPYSTTYKTPSVTTAPVVKTTPAQQPTSSVTDTTTKTTAVPKTPTQPTITVSIDNYIIKPTADSGTPFIDSSNRTQVPLRLTMEECGCTVIWDNPTKTAYVIKGDKTVSVPIGKHYISVNGTDKGIDTCAIIKDNRTYLPIRPVLEAFGYNITWNQSTKTVAITSAEETSPSANYENPDNVISEFIIKNGKYNVSDGMKYYTYTEQEELEDCTIIRTLFYDDSEKNHIITYGCQLLYSDGRDIINLIGLKDGDTTVILRKNSSSEEATLYGYVGKNFNGDNFYDTFTTTNTDIPAGSSVTIAQLKQQANYSVAITLTDFQLTMLNHNIAAGLQDYGYKALSDTFK